MLLRVVKAVLLFFLLAILFVYLTIGPEILGDYVKTLLGDEFIQNNGKYLLILLVIVIIIAVFLTTPGLGKKLTDGVASKAVSFNIPATDANRRLVKSARTAIGNASPEAALQALSEMDNPRLNDEISLLSARWVNFSKSRPRVDPNDSEFAGINKSILQLITALEKELNLGADVDIKIRKHLKDRYQKRLAQKMAGRQPVNIRRLTTTVGTSPETAKTFVSNVEGEIQGEMSKLFQDANGRLLIVGAPGSGKTTLLLRWIAELLDTEKDYLPVIVNLATWRSGFIDFKTWLQEVLPAELGINKPFAKELLAQDRLLLLCDGFDEVRKDDRESLLAAMGKYGAVRERRFVISSRIEEYKEVEKDAPVYLQIEVCPLTIEQLEAELKNEVYQPEGARLVVAMQKDGYLRQAVQTPFYFNALQLLFAHGIRLKDLEFKSRSKKGREEEITRQFVDFALDANEHHRRLSFLASRLNRNNLVSFELTDFQYDWWNWSKRELKLGNFFEGLAGGLVGGLDGGLGVGLSTGLVFGVIFGLIGGLTVGLAVGLVVGLAIALGEGLLKGVKGFIIAGQSFQRLHENSFDFPFISTRDYFYFSWKSLFSHLKNNLVSGIFLSLFISLFFGFALSLSFDLPLFESDLRGSIDISLLEVIVISLGFCLLVGLATSLGVSLNDIMRREYSHFIQITHPYQRFKGSAKMLYFSILQHWHLFHLFNKHKLLPRKIVPFLDEMARRHILESDGASWRFRHRILQDHFAEEWGNSTETTR